MKQGSLFRYGCVVMLLFFIVACSTSRHVGKSTMIGTLKGEEYLEKLIEYSPRWQAVTGKVAFDLKMGNKGSTKLNATIRMKRGEVIQLSVAPLLGIEVARIEITPVRILAVDRMYKRYMEISFDGLSGMLGAELDFNSLQSLFLNEIFLPGKARLETDDVRRFLIFSEGEQALLVPKSGRNLSYRFYTKAENGLLEKTLLGMNGTKYGLEWDYSDFSTLDGKPFPRHILASLVGPEGKDYSLDMKFSRLSTDANWETSTKLSSKYRKMELRELLDLLQK